MKTISREAYRQAFLPCGPTWEAHDPDRPLIQLGLPSATSVVLWLLPRRGEDPEFALRVAERADARQDRTRIEGTTPVRVELCDLEPGKAYAIEVSLCDRGRPSVERMEASTRAVNGRFSFLAGSCLQPFAGGKGKPTFVMNQTVHALKLLQSRASSPAPERPAFALSLGDQVYVDDGALSSSERAMLHGWKSQKIRYAKEDAEHFFETLYRANFSLEPFAAALRTLPTVMMWDDHEIRDGWGSQGDEEASERGSEIWRAHLALARRYFAAFQGIRNPMSSRALNGEAWNWQRASLPGTRLTASEELDFSFDWGEIATFFVMDQRSQRNAREERVVSGQQLERIERWLESRGDRPTLFVLGSPMPLTLARTLGDVIQYLYPPRHDDLRDSWWSRAGRKQRSELLASFARHFAAHRMHRLLVLSGDVHFSELLELTLADGSVFGHEIISSGLAQSSYFRLSFRRATQTSSRLDAGISARGLGRFFGPAFAELFVEGNGTDAPRVAVTFHTAVTEDGRWLANTTGDRLARLDLPLQEPLDLKRRGLSGLFARFTHVDPQHRSAEAATEGF